MNQGFKADHNNAERNISLVDFKRILYWALRYWYLVVFSLAVALTIAFYKNRYTQRIYPVSASIIIREKEETSGAELLYKNALVDQYRNYLNEPYIIRSYGLIQRVIDDLNFNASFYNEGYVLTTEAYRFLPIRPIIAKGRPVNRNTYRITLLNNRSYTLEVTRDKESLKK